MNDTKQEARVIIGEELEALRKTIIAHHLNAGQRASGRTERSLHVEFTDSTGTLYGRQAFGVLEVGRAGGKVPKGFYKVILQWMQDKGIQVEKPKSFAFLVARKIAKEGTKVHREGKIVDIYSQEIPKTVQNILDRLFGVFAKDVQHINLNSNEKD
ncbi:MAG: hypothetical protein RSH25_14905 [Bacteroides sp.]|uniref:hypothetical protein n=1 Tax=Bacteroides sp. TaxID=29523 RepID=UPI002FCC8A14